ncbi:MAG: FHA domain-containing protein [Lachnospiraceae bacterium]|nr:FHA domain-containing protein [Lachnospiraceae bacterium]
MEVSYKRTYKESYMIITGTLGSYQYEEMMLKENELKTLLTFYTMEVNGKTQFWYDISSKQSIKDYLEQNPLSFELLIRIFAAIMVAFEEVTKYLLRTEHILLSAETIYVSRQEGQEVYLCYYPGNQDEKSGLSDLLNHIIGVLDYGDDDLTKLCYSLYEMTLDEHTTIGDLYEYIQANLPGNFIQESDSAEEYSLDGHCNLHKDNDEMNIPRAYEKSVETMDKADDFTGDYKTEWMENSCGGEENAKEIAQSDFDYDGNIIEEIFRRIREKGIEIYDLIMSWQKGKSDASKDNRTIENDLIIEPEPIECEPTVYLGRNCAKVYGSLRYIGNEKESDYIIDSNIFRIGTHGANDACLNSQTVSRHHAKINEIDNHFYIQDLNSTNGTFLNDIMLNYSQSYELNPGDRITFADVPYIFS